MTPSRPIACSILEVPEKHPSADDNSNSNTPTSHTPGTSDIWWPITESHQENFFFFILESYPLSQDFHDGNDVLVGDALKDPGRSVQTAHTARHGRDVEASEE